MEPELNPGDKEWVLQISGVILAAGAIRAAKQEGSLSPCGVRRCV